MKQSKDRKGISWGSKKVNSLFDKITSQALKKHGFLNFKIISDWHLIIGPDLARFTVPLRIDFPYDQTSQGVLYVACSNPGFSLEIQASEGSIINKLSTYFGYKAISRIKVVIDKAAERNTERALEIIKEQITENEFDDIQNALSSVSDPKLKENLNELFKTLFEKEDN